MNKKIVAITGSYRKGGITDQAVDAILKTVSEKGAETHRIVLTEQGIEFCKNCRHCTADAPEKRRGKCVLEDNMERLLSLIDEAAGVVLAAPINFGDVTAIMKRFIERLVVYGYWPWGMKYPKNRIRKRDKKAVILTSSGAPAFIGRILMPSAAKAMKGAAEIIGARVVQSIHFGMVSMEEHQRLSPKQLKRAQAAARKL